MARVGNQRAAETSVGLETFPLQTLGKCPLFWQLLQMASLAGHLEGGCLEFPQKKHFGSAAASVEVNLRVNLILMNYF